MKYRYKLCIIILILSILSTAFGVVEANEQRIKQTTSLYNKLLLNKIDHLTYIKGYEDGTFKSEETVTRAEITAIFTRIITDSLEIKTQAETLFVDVKNSDWFRDYINHLVFLEL